MMHSHHLSYVAVSILIAIIGSWTALDLHRRVGVHRGSIRLGWLSACAVAMGLSIWSMHFIAMLGLDAGMPVRYDIGLTLSSFLLAVASTGGAFVAVEQPSPSARRVLLAALAMGSGICLMHYVGMAALRAPATLAYRTDLVVASWVIAVTASWAALQAALRKPSSRLRALGAVVLGLAIASMHFTGMAALTMTPTATSPAGAGLDSLTLAFAIASSTLLLLFLALATAMFDRRVEALALAEAVASARADSEARLRAVEAERRLLQSELVHVSRVSAMGAMGGALEHELNQPLAAISNYAAAARLLLAQGDLAGDGGSRLRTALDCLGEEALRAGSIIRQLRKMVAKGEAETGTQHLAAIVEEAVSLALVGAREAGVSCRLDLDRDLRVMADRIQVQQVVFNLARNAVEAMEAAPQRVLVITTGRRDRQAIIRVQDSGPGLPDEVRSKLFVPFVTTKGDGLGVGLSICKTIVDAHRGELWAEAPGDSGACFCFTLPLADEAAVDEATEAARRGLRAAVRA